jgi:mannose-1-phosphate guanylyltransferase
MRAMIMAAGLGTRLKPLTGFIPKPMVPIANRPALYHILRLLARHGITEVVVNLHHLPDTVTSYFGNGAWLGVDLRYAFEERLLGTAGGVKNNQGFLGDDTFLVLSGDALTDVDLTALLAAHRAQGGIATLAVAEVDDSSQYGVVVIDDEERVTGFQEKPRPEDALSNLCNCGMYVFEPDIFERIPAAEFYDFGTMVLPELLRDDLVFHTHTAAGYWNDVGSLPEYRRGSFDALAGVVSVERTAREVQPGVWIGARTLLGRGVEIRPPVLIGDECTIDEGATLKGPVVLGDQCVVGRGAHVDKSIVWGGTYVGSGAVISESILARSVHVGRGARLAGAVVGERSVVPAGSDIGDAVLDAETEMASGGPREMDSGGA